MRTVGLLLLVACAFVGCTSESATPTPVATVGDAEGRRACDELAKLLAARRGGAQQPGEFLAGAQGVYESGRFSKHGAIAEHSTTLFRVSVSGTPEDVESALDALANDCNLD